MYRIEMLCDGRWCPIAGRFTKSEAEYKVVQYLMASSRKRYHQYRVVLAR